MRAHGFASNNVGCLVEGDRSTTKLKLQLVLHYIYILLDGLIS
jgi:hypothetical protein